MYFTQGEVIEGGTKTCKWYVSWGMEGEKLR